MWMEYSNGIKDGSITRPIRNMEDNVGWRRYLAEFSLAMGGFWIFRTLIQAVTGLALDGFMHILVLMVPTAAVYFGMQLLLWNQVKK